MKVLVYVYNIYIFVLYIFKIYKICHQTTGSIKLQVRQNDLSSFYGTHARTYTHYN